MIAPPPTRRAFRPDKYNWTPGAVVVAKPGAGAELDIDAWVVEIAAENAASAPGDEASADLTLAATLKSPIILEALGVPVDFAGLTTALDEAEARIIRALAPLQVKQRNRIVRAARAIVQRGDTDAVAAFAIEGDEEAAAILAELVALYERGGESVMEEIEAQGPKPSAVDRVAKAAALAFLGALAAEAARSLVDRMRTAWGTAVLGQMRTGYNAAALDAAVTAPGERLLADVARRGSSTALGMGRMDAVGANADKVGREVWSAAMDENTCGPCAALDGEEFAVGEGPAAPYAGCEGGARCRCIRVPIAVSERAGAELSMRPFPVCADCGEPIAFAGQPCGGSWIAAGKTCRAGAGAHGKAKDISGELEGIAGRVGGGRSVVELQNMPENPLLYEVTRMQDMHGAADVLSPEEFDALPGDHTRVYRGVLGDEYASPERFAEDAVWYGRGVSGDGIYTSTKETEARSYAGGETRNVMSMAIKPDARVVEYDDLRKEYNAAVGDRGAAETRIRESYTERFNAVSRRVASGDLDRGSGGAEIRRIARLQEDEIKSYRHPLDGLDMGTYAAAKGYDVIRNNQFADRFVGEHYVVLNRRALVVRGRR